MTFWTDSTIVLHWITSPPSTWKVFVSNRIAEIQRLTKNFQWRHIPTTDNSADRISRGAEPQQLLQGILWWSGPPCLLLSAEDWPDSIFALSPSMIEQQELAPLLRITAYCKRFAFNCRAAKQDRNSGKITLHEYDNALKSLISLSQQTAFSVELQYLRCQDGGKRSLRDAQFKSPIKNLDLMFDSIGLLRIHGRLSELPGSYDSRFPMVLAADHHLSKLIARSIHHQTLHAGPTQLLATIRQRFWPVSGRDLARRTVHHCVTCFRCCPKGRFGKSRGRSVRLFAVKAVVLDIVAGLSAAACVNSLRRFVSRIGRVRVIHCDNSTSFFGAFREVKEMRQQFIEQLKSSHWANECLEKGIEFQFIPPRAPHFGGLWGAAVKAFKHHLYRIMGSSPYHLDDLRTAVAQAEGILNSRPLTPLSNNPEDLSVLTPAHFILEYISLLHQRPAKWRKSPTEFKIGSMIILEKDNTPLQQWPLGRIVAVYPNKDGIVRVVDVRTQAGIRRRATTQVCLLPIEEPQNENHVDSAQPNIEELP
ncbi:uncharacterized protein LOC131687548 [Topomyia yanbarensis]|uniref:uncharacterized protein LOC131687548 n=1 Tax=Topomyia yanbarensis TaxID=2498891 RepID=UPI00273B9470|nr:uncharacterized protein LOC131687548 [Topomyia yanbarensis]